MSLGAGLNRPLVEFTKEDFDVNLGVFIMRWIEIVGIDQVIDALDSYVHTLEERRDRELLTPPPAPKMGAGA